jgi:hypothetical protein
LTLVYAEKEGLQVRIWSDTKVSSKDATRPEIIPGRLKIVVCNPDLAIAFADSVTGCLDIIRKIGRGQTNIELLLSDLLKHNSEFPDDSQFIVAYKDSIFKISNGELLENLDRCFIGDNDSASAFLKLRRQDISFEATCIAFQKVIKDTNYPLVDGLPYLVVRDSNGKYFYERGLGVTNPNPILPGQVVLVDSGGVEDGGYSYTFVTPKISGIGLAAVFFPPANLGYLYAPLDSDLPIFFGDVTLDEFKGILNKNTGVEFVSLNIRVM